MWTVPDVIRVTLKHARLVLHCICHCLLHCLQDVAY
jgi:hypothetical protein